jgi:hypothetical protein
MDTAGSNVWAATLSYRHFNPYIIDAVWQDDLGNGTYNLYHKRMKKGLTPPTDYGGCPDAAEREAIYTPSPFEIFPNPFNSRTVITLSEKDRGKGIRVDIYNTHGQLVRSFMPGAGETSILWDGKTRNGEKAPAGVYILKAGAGNREITRKMVLHQ